MSSQSETEEAETAETAGDAAETAADTTAAGVATADSTGEEPAAASAPDGDRADPAESDQVPSFLREIARAMQAAVDRERGRITAETTSSLDAHVQEVRVRAATEAADLKLLARQDVDEIRAWSAAEAERLRLETESRIGARREDLGRHLRQHEALVDREISGASEAFEEYRAELDRFVSRVAGEQQPSEIMRLVKLLPEPPHVDDVAAAARAHAFAQLSRSEGAADAESAGPDVVGVMDPGVVGPSAESPTAASDLDDVGGSRQHTPRRPSIAELDNPLGLVVFIAVLAIVMVVVLTGQGGAG